MNNKHFFSLFLTLVSLAGLVVFYPKNAQAQTLTCGVLETITVQPLNPAVPGAELVANSSNLPAGQYILKARGTYIYKPVYQPTGGIADAGYILVPAHDSENLNTTDNPQWLNNSVVSGQLGIRVNGSVVNWGSYNSSHEYTYTYSHAGGSIPFVIKDSYHADNSGNLSVEISRVCVTPTPTPTLAPTATPKPTIAPTSTPKATVAPTSVPSATSTPNPTSGKRSSMGKNGPSCSNNNIEVTFDVREDGNPRENVEVKFKYNGEEKTAKSNSNGRASVSYGNKGKGSISGEPSDGYPSQSVNVDEIGNCPAPNSASSSTPTPVNSSRLTSNSGRSSFRSVLGASTSRSQLTITPTPTVEASPSATPTVMPTTTPAGNVLGETVANVCKECFWFPILLFYVVAMTVINWMARNEKKNGGSVRLYVLGAVAVSLLAYGFYLIFNWSCISRWFLIVYHVSSSNFFCNYLPLIVFVITGGSFGFWAMVKEEK